MKPSFGRAVARLAAPAIMVVGATCSDSGTSPSPATRHTAVTVAASFPNATSLAARVYHAANLDVDRVRVTVVRAAADILKDTTVLTTPGQSSVTLRLDVDAPNGEQLSAAIEFRSGAMVLYAGQAPVIAQLADAGSSAVPATIAVTPAAPGANAANISVSPTGVAFPTSGTVPFSVRVLSASGSEISSPVIAWTSSDPTVATIDAASGLVKATGKAGAVTVRATAPNGVFGEGTVSFLSPPGRIVVVSGDKQTGEVGVPLASPLVVEVQTAEGTPIPNQAVIFGSSGGGIASPSTVTTDTKGRAQTVITPGTALGTYAFVASIGSISAGVSATAVAGSPVSVVAFSGGGQSDAIQKTLKSPLVARVSDRFGNPAKGIAVAWRNSGPGALSATSSVTDADGQASVTFTLGAVVGAESVTASVAGVTGEASFAVTATPAPPPPPDRPVAITLSLVSGNGQTASVGVTLNQIIVKVSDAQGNPFANDNVTFAVGSGSGTVIVLNGTTDAGSLARAAWTLGPTLGTQTLIATRPGLVGSPLTIVATATTAGGGTSTPVSLAFQTQPGNGSAGAALTPAVTVAALDAQGRVVTTYTGNVTIALASNPGSATLQGTLTRPAVAGVATFNDLSLPAAGAGYTLGATSGSLIQATSSPFIIGPNQLGGAPGTWTGAVSTDWNTAGNWIGGVPTAATNVVIPAGTPNQPTLAAAATINDLSVAGSLQLTGAPLTVAGNVSVSGTGITGSGLLSMTGAGKTVTGSIRTLDIVGTVTVAGTTSVANKVTVSSGSLTIPSGTSFSATAADVSGGTFALGGGTSNISAFTVTGTGVFAQTSGTLSAGAATFGGASTAGRITGGTLKISVLFAQTSSSSPQSFAASGTHVTQFITDNQTVSFESPAQSHFQTLQLDGRIVLQTPAVATGQLVTFSSAAVVQSFSGQLLTVAGLDVASLLLDNVLLSSVGGTITRFDNVRITNVSPSATPLTISHPGAGSHFVFNKLQYFVTPTTGKYLSVTDTSPNDGNVLTIDLLNSVPLGGSALTTTSGGAVVNWGPVAGQNHWINDTGGSWNTASNWSLGHVPAAGDAIFIDRPGTYTVTLGAAFSGKALTVGGAAGTQTLAMSGGVLSMITTFTVAPGGVLGLTNASASCSCTISNQGLIIANGDAGMGDPFTNTASSIIRIQADASTQFATLTFAAGLGFPSTFVNAGRIELTSIGGAYPATIQAGGSTGTVTNGPNGTIATLAGAGGTRTLGRLDNRGLLDIGTTTNIGTRFTPLLTNSGTIRVAGGDLRAPLGSWIVTNTGTITISPTRTLDLSDVGTFTQQAGATINGGGAVVLGGGTATINAPLVISSLTLGPGTLNLGVDLSTASMALSIDGVTVNGPGRLVNAVGQTLSVNRLTVAASSALVNQGTLISNGVTTINGQLTTSVGSTIRLLPNGPVPAESFTVTHAFTNAGTIELTSSGGAVPSQIAVTGGALTNTGTIASLAGTGGTRTIQGDVINQGTLTVAPGAAGTLTITGTLTNSGAINMELGGSTTGQFDALQVSGAATLCGTLNVTLLNGFTPVTGNSFPLITYSSVTGDFASYNLPGGGAAWTRATPPAGTALTIVKN